MFLSSQRGSGLTLRLDSHPLVLLLILTLPSSRSHEFRAETGFPASNSFSCLTRLFLETFSFLTRNRFTSAASVPRERETQRSSLLIFRETARPKYTKSRKKVATIEKVEMKFKFDA